MLFLITGAWNDSTAHLNEIKAHGHRVLFLQNEKDKLPCDAAIIEAVICNGLFLFHDIRTFTSLKYIQLTSAGYDRVPMDYIREHNIHIVNAKGVYSVPMAEHVILGVLELYRKSRKYYSLQKEKVWLKDRNLLEICHKKVLIVGCGSVGRECALRFKAFSAFVVGIDEYSSDTEAFDRIYTPEFFDDCIKDSDIIVFTVPLTDQTRNMLNRDRIACLKNTAVVINVSRGQIIDNNALIEALSRDKILGAVLDVFDKEPLDPDSPLWEMNQVILTPHVSFIGDNNANRLWECIRTNFVDYQNVNN